MDASFKAADNASRLTGRSFSARDVIMNLVKIESMPICRPIKIESFLNPPTVVHLTRHNYLITRCGIEPSGTCKMPTTLHWRSS